MVPGCEFCTKYSPRPASARSRRGSQRVDELAAQGFDLDAIGDGPKVAYVDCSTELVRCLDRFHCNSLDLLRLSRFELPKRAGADRFASGPLVWAVVLDQRAVLASRY
jgi:hypothetical protein